MIFIKDFLISHIRGTDLILSRDNPIHFRVIISKKGGNIN